LMTDVSMRKESAGGKLLMPGAVGYHQSLAEVQALSSGN